MRGEPADPFFWRVIPLGLLEAVSAGLTFGLAIGPFENFSLVQTIVYLGFYGFLYAAMASIPALIFWNLAAYLLSRWTGLLLAAVLVSALSGVILAYPVAALHRETFREAVNQRDFALSVWLWVTVPTLSGILAYFFFRRCPPIWHQ